MITGIITPNLDAVIELDIAGPARQPQRIRAVIDTGYNGYLTLPGDLVAALQLSFYGHRRGMLADGSVVRLDVFLAIVAWHGEQREVVVSQAESTPLVGMSLLHGDRLTIDVIDGGDVMIDELP